MSHTPGPWTTSIATDVQRCNVKVVGDRAPWYVAYNATQDDARLIAAAPDLLELAAFVYAVLGTDNSPQACDKAFGLAAAAIAKATGTSHLSATTGVQE